MGNFVQTIKSRGKLDDPQNWADDQCIRPPEFDVKKFQSKLDKVCGLTPQNQSIVRLKWAWDSDCYSLHHIEWDGKGIPTKNELRAKYAFTSVDLGNDVHVDICPPRFVFEELLTAAQYFDAWEKNRWQFSPELKINVPLRPKPDNAGYYRFLYWVCTHDNNKSCCERAQEESQECYGLYRLPDQSDIRYFQKGKKYIETTDTVFTPYKPIGAEVLQNVLEDTERAERDRKEERENQRDDDRKELSSIIKPETGYSFPNETRTKSGIILSN